MVATVRRVKNSILKDNGAVDTPHTPEGLDPGDPLPLIPAEDQPDDAPDRQAAEAAAAHDTVEALLEVTTTDQALKAVTSETVPDL